MTSDDPDLIHASAVSWDGRAALIIGASGSGKSSLALQLMALGCDLVADDQCHIADEAGQPQVAAPPTLPSLIEARGVGLLSAPLAQSATVRLVVDMDQHVTERLPAEQTMDITGHPVKVIGKVEGPHFPATILLYLKQTLLS